MSETTKSLEAYQVPGWLSDLCAHLQRSKDPFMRAAAEGLLINRKLVGAKSAIQQAKLESRFRKWTRALTPKQLDEIEAALIAHLIRMERWLDRLIVAGFPEQSLVDFARERELMEAASCVLVWRDRNQRVQPALDEFDREVVAAITEFEDGDDERARELFVNRDDPLLKLARDRENMHWWGVLAGTDS